MDHLAMHGVLTVHGSRKGCDSGQLLQASSTSSYVPPAHHIIAFHIPTSLNHTCSMFTSTTTTKQSSFHPSMHAAQASSNSLDVDAIRRLYGSALAMRLTTERQNAQNVGGRLPGLDAHPNSNILYETLTGDDVTIDFGDFLNTSGMRPEGFGVGVGRDGVHSAMEAKLGL